MQAPTGTAAWESDLRLKLRDAPPPVKARDHQIAAVVLQVARRVKVPVGSWRG